jgi:hypothetical protein
MAAIVLLSLPHHQCHFPQCSHHWAITIAAAAAVATALPISFTVAIAATLTLAAAITDVVVATITAAHDSGKS